MSIRKQEEIQRELNRISSAKDQIQTRIISNCLARNMSVEEIYKSTGISMAFINEKIAEMND